MLQKMNRRNAERNEHDPDLEARIGAFELAFRMQMKAPEAFEAEKESAGDQEALRTRQPGDARFRMAVPAGAAPFRARRALRAVLATATGTSTPSCRSCTRSTRRRSISRSPGC